MPLIRIKPGLQGAADNEFPHRVIKPRDSAILCLIETLPFTGFLRPVTLVAGLNCIWYEHDKTRKKEATAKEKERNGDLP